MSDPVERALWWIWVALMFTCLWGVRKARRGSRVEKAWFVVAAVLVTLAWVYILWWFMGPLAFDPLPPPVNSR